MAGVRATISFSHVREGRTRHVKVTAHPHTANGPTPHHEQAVVTSVSKARDSTQATRPAYPRGVTGFSRLALR